MSVKPKVAFYWCASCGGCEETVVDLEEKVLDIVNAVDIVFWPCAMDFKYSDVEALADGEIAVSLVNGAIRTSEQEHVAKLLRKKSGLVVAFGSCAAMGGIPALANLTSKNEILKRAYLESPTNVNPERILPSTTATFNGKPMGVPEFYETVHTLGEFIDVDYFIPGCPPSSEILLNAVSAILSGTLPPKGSILLSDKVLCASCDRNESKPENIENVKFHRVINTEVKEDTCLLAQGILCMGPATRDGCDFPCVKGNMPCTGCNGPVKNADQGARIISAVGGIVQGETPEAAAEGFTGIADPAGTFYRYSLSSSLLGAHRKEHS
jgi:F420-non-reducing hydrogenase small subunit